MYDYESDKSDPIGWLKRTVVASPVTSALVVVNVVVFLLLTATGGSTDTANLYRWGAKFGPAIQAGDWFRLISPVVLHAGVFHVIANTFALVLFGPRLESDFGKIAFSATYLVSGVCGVAASYLVSPVLSVGASGAVFGIVGAYGVYLIRNRRDFGASVNPVIFNLAIVLAINISFGLFVPGIDQGAHVGGLITGAAMGWFICPKRVVSIEDDFSLFGTPVVRTRFARASTQQVMRIAAVGLIVAAVITWWVTNNVVYDSATMGMYGYFKLATG